MMKPIHTVAAAALLITLTGLAPHAVATTKTHQAEKPVCKLVTVDNDENVVICRLGEKTYIVPEYDKTTPSADRQTETRQWETRGEIRIA